MFILLSRLNVQTQLSILCVYVKIIFLFLAYSQSDGFPLVQYD